MAQWNALSDGWEKDGNSGKWKAEFNQKTVILFFITFLYKLILWI